MGLTAARLAFGAAATHAHDRDGNRPKSIAKDHLILDEDEVMVDCRIGAVAPLSDTPGVSGNKGLRGAWHARHEIESASTCAA